MAAYSYRHRVTYADCTLGNHVYYARYLDLLEAARGEFFRQLGATLLEWQERGTIFPVIEARLRYRAAARYDDVLTIAVRVMAVDRLRLDFAYSIVNQNHQRVLEAETRHVCAGLNEKPKRLPEELAAVLRSLLSPAVTA